MKDVEKIAEKVKKRKDQLQSLFTKDEENYDLWAGKEQKFDTHKMSINITGTEMVSLARRMQSSLTRSRLDIHVLPPKPLPNPDAIDEASQEERMYYHGFTMADERLHNIGEASLMSQATWQSIVLGRVCVRVCVYKQGKDIVWDYLPMNPRFVTFSFDSKGLAWYAYETFRSPFAIKEEYGKEVTEDVQGKGISVIDYWDREHNIRYLLKDKEILGKAWKHPFKEVPAIVQPVSLGPKAITSDGIDVTAWGQSIYDHVKIPFRNLNKIRSIIATQAFINAQPPLEVIMKGGAVEGLEEKEINRYPMATLQHPDTIELKVLDTKDIPPSIITMQVGMEKGLDRATYTELSPDAPAHSGAALRILAQDKQDVLDPRQDAINNLYTRICRMVKKQILKQKLTIEVRTVVNGDYQIYDIKPTLLNNDFYVNAEIVRHDAYDEEASLQRAQLLQQTRLAPKAKILEYELKVQDVPAWMDEIDTEDVEAAVPEMKLKRIIKRYRDRGMDEEANLLEEKLGLLKVQDQQVIKNQMMPTGQGMQGRQGMPTRTQGATPTGVRR